MFPTETQVANPISRSIDQSRIAVHKAPDCERNVRRPGRGITGEKLAFRCEAGRSTPRQFGPTKRKLGNSRRTASKSDSSLRPSGPASRKPAEMTIIPPTRSVPASRTSCGTVAAGVDTITRSGTSGRSANPANAFSPLTVACLRLTAHNGPGN